MPERMIDFVAFWRSRGYTRRSGFKLWLTYQHKGYLSPGDFRWAKA